MRTLTSRPARARGLGAAIALLLLTPALLFSAGPAHAAHLSAPVATYTRDADFDEGAKVNVDHYVADQLQLDESVEMFEFIWIAVSSKGTAVKVDTVTGAVLGEYRTAPGGMLTNPSRTTVDHKGNVWVTNRDESSLLAGQARGSIIHIGLEENNQCVDRNGNGVIDTSTGLGDVRAWTNAGSVDTDGGVDTAADECILHFVRTASTNNRHVSVTSTNDVWVSGTGVRAWELIDDVTGAIIRSEASVGCGGYGGLIDGNGVIWSARPFFRWDTALPLTPGNYVCDTSFDSYGLCLDGQGNVWNTALSGNQIRKYASNGALLGTFSHGFNNAQGCVVDMNDHVWVAHSILGGGSSLGHLRNDGFWVGNVAVGSGPTGVAVDKAGKVWSTDHNTRKATRVDPNAGPVGADLVTPVGAVDLTTVDLLGNLYNYSDMTGWVALLVRRSGTWTIAHDTTVPNAKWGTVSWTADVFADGDLTVQVQTSNDGITWSAPTPAVNGGTPAVPDGRYVRAVVTFVRATTGESPILYDISFNVNQAAKCFAWGALVKETDHTGLVGHVNAPYSYSHVRTEAASGTWPSGPAPGAAPTKPNPPQASANAQQAGFSYNNAALGVDLRASTIFSECHGLARHNATGTFAHAYGRAGIQELSLTQGGVTVLHAEAVDYEAHAVGRPSGTTISRACDIAELRTLPPGPSFEYCPPANTQIPVTVGPVTVTVTFNESLAPISVPGGYWLYGGAAVHVRITTPTTTIDVYLGLVLVCVPGDGFDREPPVCRPVDVYVPVDTRGGGILTGSTPVDGATVNATDECLPDCRDLEEWAARAAGIRTDPCDPECVRDPSACVDCDRLLDGLVFPTPTPDVCHPCVLDPAAADCLECRAVWSLLFPGIDLQPHPCEPCMPESGLPCEPACEPYLAPANGVAVSCDVPECKLVARNDGAFAFVCVTPRCPDNVTANVCETIPVCIVGGGNPPPAVFLECVPPGCALYLEPGGGGFLQCDPADPCAVLASLGILACIDGTACDTTSATRALCDTIAGLCAESGLALCDRLPRV